VYELRKQSNIESSIHVVTSRHVGREKFGPTPNASGALRAERMPAARSGSASREWSSMRVPVGTEHALSMLGINGCDMEIDNSFLLRPWRRSCRPHQSVAKRAQARLSNKRAANIPAKSRQSQPSGELSSPRPSRGRRREAGHLFRPVRPVAPSPDQKDGNPKHASLSSPGLPCVGATNEQANSGGVTTAQTGERRGGLCEDPKKT